MKLFRFELKAEPGTARSGMVHGGRVYEVEGGEAASVHEASEVRPLSPVPLPGSVRFFRTQNQPVGEEPDPAYFYGNPAAIVGASTLVNAPAHLGSLTFETYLAAVLVAGGYDIPVEEADEHLLGLSIMVALVDRGAMRTDSLFGRSHDLGLGLGPVVTTPDELDGNVVDASFGRRYKLGAVAKVNGVEVGRGDAEDLPYSIAQAVSAASRSCTLREGDVIALGPLVDIPEASRLDGGDEINVAVEGLGALSLKLSLDA